ncbi:MAG: hypothetical protein AABZ60_20850 [Planctomycetota bacterium]
MRFFFLFLSGGMLLSFLVAFSEFQQILPEKKRETEPYIAYSSLSLITNTTHVLDCAGGCGTVPSSLPTLRDPEIILLLEQLGQKPLTEENSALETILFHWKQVREYLMQHGFGSLSETQIDFLKKELSKEYVFVSLRGIDEEGVERIHMKSYKAPLGIKQHIYIADPHQLQPLEASGTVQRVGLNHLWTRI